MRYAYLTLILLFLAFGVQVVWRWFNGSGLNDPKLAGLADFGDGDRCDERNRYEKLPRAFDLAADRGPVRVSGVKGERKEDGERNEKRVEMDA